MPCLVGLYMPMPGMPPVPMPMPYGGMYAPGMPGPNPYGAPAPIPAHALRGFTDEDVTALHDVTLELAPDKVGTVWLYTWLYSCDSYNG